MDSAPSPGPPRRPPACCPKFHSPAHDLGLERTVRMQSIDPDADALGAGPALLDTDDEGDDASATGILALAGPFIHAC